MSCPALPTYTRTNPVLPCFSLPVRMKPQRHATCPPWKPYALEQRDNDSLDIKRLNHAKTVEQNVSCPALFLLHQTDGHALTIRVEWLPHSTVRPRIVQSSYRLPACDGPIVDSCLLPLLLRGLLPYDSWIAPSHGLRGSAPPSSSPTGVPRTRRAIAARRIASQLHCPLCLSQQSIAGTELHYDRLVTSLNCANIDDVHRRMLERRMAS